MLQQTQAGRVEAAYPGFLERFPDVAALASASRADVVRAWGDLGYPRRAVALHEGARAVVARHAGRVPADPESLRALPGVGPYTAAAIAAIGHGAPVAALDTNVRRVVARVGWGAEPHAVAPAELAEAAAAWVDRRDPGRWQEALMDLGRERCVPRRPACATCPLEAWCAFARAARSGTGAATAAAPDGRARDASAPRRRQLPYEGSMRQLRGRVLALARTRARVRRAELVAETGEPADRLDEAIRGLAADGLIEVSRAGVVRLPG
jgi:A/G-specific adenine glycosylase